MCPYGSLWGLYVSLCVPMCPLTPIHPIMPAGAAAGSLFAGGRLALDPELRGAEFERLTQRLDVGFWKSFWGLTESHLLAVSLHPIIGP